MKRPVIREWIIVVMIRSPKINLFAQEERIPVFHLPKQLRLLSNNLTGNRDFPPHFMF